LWNSTVSEDDDACCGTFLTENGGDFSEAGTSFTDGHNFLAQNC
jgi:hypothetical protein